MVGAELDVPVVVGMGGGDVDQFQVGVADQVLIAAEGFLNPVGLGKGLGPGQVPGAHGVEFQLGVAVFPKQVDGVGHGAGNVPGAQNADFHDGYLP